MDYSISYSGESGCFFWGKFDKSRINYDILAKKGQRGQKLKRNSRDNLSLELQEVFDFVKGNQNPWG